MGANEGSGGEMGHGCWGKRRIKKKSRMFLVGMCTTDGIMPQLPAKAQRHRTSAWSLKQSAFCIILRKHTRRTNFQNAFCCFNPDVKKMSTGERNSMVVFSFFTPRHRVIITAFVTGS